MLSRVSENAASRTAVAPYERLSTLLRRLCADVQEATRLTLQSLLQLQHAYDCLEDTIRIQADRVNAELYQIFRHFRIVRGRLAANAAMTMIPACSLFGLASR